MANEIRGDGSSVLILLVQNNYANTTTACDVSVPCVTSDTFH